MLIRSGVGCLVMMAAVADVRATPPAEVAVKLAPKHGGVALPLQIEATEVLAAAGARNLHLTDVGTGELIAGQLGRTGAGLSLWFTIPAKDMDRAVTRRFRVVDSAEQRPAFEIVDDGRALTIHENGRPVLAYCHAMVLKPGVPEKFRRSCYIHPIYDLDGVVLTDDFPKDHYHHRGLNWTWPHVRLEGEGTIYDLWALSGMEQRFIRVLGSEVGPVCARLGVVVGWYIGERKVIDETMWLTAFRADEVGRAIDVDLTLEATGDPVTIGGREKKGYGGFTLRFAPRDETMLWTSAGPLDRDADHDRFGWADLSARLTGGTGVSGAAIFDNPENPGTPNTWCLRRYGIVSPTYPGLEKHEIKSGAPLRLRYRAWIHRGGAEAGKVASAYAAYAEGPEIRVTAIH